MSLALQIGRSSVNSNRMSIARSAVELAELPVAEAGARALIYRLGPDAFTDHALLGWARSWDSANDPAWRELATLPQRFTAPEFPLKAADFIKRGIAKGPALGAALRAAEAAWIAQGFPQDQVSLDKISDSAAAGG